MIPLPREEIFKLNFSFNVGHLRWCIKSQNVCLFNYQSHTRSYFVHVILATSFGSKHEPSSDH
jgi:hypothetical protein